MKKIKLLALCIPVSLLTACKQPELTGTLRLSQSIQALRETDKKPVPVEIAAGEYKATARLRDKNTTLYLTIDGAKSSPNLKFEIPSKFPLKDGEFRIGSKVTGQPFGLHGVIKSTSQNSNSQTQFENCQYRAIEHICTNTGCFPREVWANGSQRVRFHYKTTESRYDVDLENQDLTVVGDFRASSISEEKVYEYKENCF